MFRGLKPLRTHYRGNGGVSLAGRKVTLPSRVPIHTIILLRQLRPLLRLPVGKNSVPVAARQNFVHGKVNHVTVEEAQEAPDMVIGTFSINDLSAVVLFDSGASHSFISAAYVEKHNLPMALLISQMIVSSLGGDTPARQLCPKVNLKIRGGRLCRQPYSLGIKGHRRHT
jgi:hypothetical protein